MTIRRIFLFTIFCAAAAVTHIGAQTAVTLPVGFSTLRLGMEIDEVKERLLSDPHFNFRGDPDVSLLARPNETLIECRGYTYVDRGFFQFFDGKLYTITVMLNRTQLDHYTMYQTLTGKYGDPADLNPEKASWLSDVVSITLERPLTVKYIDRQVFEGIREAGKAEETARVLLRDEFLELF